MPAQLPPAELSKIRRHYMTTITMETTASVRRLEELVDRLLAALLGDDALADMAAASLARTVHQARRLRQTADPVSGTGQALDGALATLADVDIRQASDSELRWLYAEWLDVARRRFTGDYAMLYSPATGKAAALLPTNSDNTTLEVAAVLGMCWPVGKVVSKRTLRGLRPLAKGVA